MVALSTGGAYAAGTITGRDVKNGSLTGRDVKQGSIGRADLAPAARGLTGGTGATGPAGPTGPAGTGGPAIESATGGEFGALPTGTVVRSVVVTDDQAGLNHLSFSAHVLQGFINPLETSTTVSCVWRVNGVGPDNAALPRVVLTTTTPKTEVALADTRLLQLVAGDTVTVECTDAESEMTIQGPRLVMLRISD